jgi:RNA binding exosome subunit
MRLAHTIAITVFSGEEEDAAAIEKALKRIIPLDFEKENLHFVRENCKGFEEKRIVVVRLFLSKESHTSLFLKKLSESLSQEQKYTLTHQRNRLGGDMNYFLRLDKPQFLQGNFVLTDEGNCIHIRIHLAAYPKNREAAWKVVENIFK